MVQTTPSFAYRCTWWDGTLTLSTRMTITSWTQTTGLALVLTCASTHYSRPILRSRGCYASKTLSWPCFLWNLKICPTTAGRKSYNPIPATRIPTPTTIKLLFWWSWWTIVMASATYQTFLLSLVILAGWHLLPPILSTATSSLVMLCRYCNSVGRSTPYRGDTLLQLFSLETCHSMSKWLTTHMNQEAPCFRNSRHVDSSLVLQTTCSITFVHRGTPLSSMGKWFIPLVFKTATQPLSSGRCRLNNLGPTSHTFALNQCCHCSPRTWRL